MIYRIYIRLGKDIPDAAYTVDSEPMISFLFDPANTDYQQFKADVLAGATLEDADGVPMTQEQADAFIKELP